MTQEEFNSINWRRGNVAKLLNGKEYEVKGTKSHGKLLLLFSTEYEKMFVANHSIVESRTSDYEEPEEIYLEQKRQKQALVQARIEAERAERLRIKEERRQRNLAEQERIHLEAVARKEAAKAAKQAERAAAKAAAKDKQEPKPLPAPKAKAVAKEEVAPKAKPTVKEKAAPQPKQEAKPVVSKPVAEPKKEPVVTKPATSTDASATPAEPKKKRKRIIRVEKVNFK